MNRRFPLAFVFVGLLVLSACKEKAGQSGTGAVDASGRCVHEIKQEKCPFCTPSLVESEGFCGEHGVAEALCAQCRPYLKAAFRAKGDWCADHEVPESQCVQCDTSLKEKIRPGVHGSSAADTQNSADPAECEHSIPLIKCPFCTPGLIESEGQCKEHGVAEAMCVQCRPFLETAFKAKGDWCKEHSTPESQCTICHPDLKDNQDGG